MFIGKHLFWRLFLIELRTPFFTKHLQCFSITLSRSQEFSETTETSELLCNSFINSVKNGAGLGGFLKIP